MTIVAARALRDGTTCFVGIGLPSVAANLARLLHAPSLVLIYESGTIGSKPDVLPLSIGDAELAETADAVVSVPEIFAFWLQTGRIDVGFLGAAQIDRWGNINTTAIGPYETPRVRLPGAGGAPEIAAHAREVIVVLRHTPRAFVDKVDFITTPTSLHAVSGGSPPRPGQRGLTRVITDLGVLEPDAADGQLMLAAVHPGITVQQAREATSWPLHVSPGLTTTEPPTDHELRVLRELQARTAAATGARSDNAPRVAE
jgi:glutaconate CoA-transferase subunit B